MILSVFFKHKRGGFNNRLYCVYRALARCRIPVHYVSVEKFPIEDQLVFPHVMHIPSRRKESLLFWLCFLVYSPIFIAYTALKKKAQLLLVFDGFYATLCIFAKIISRIPIVSLVRSDVLKEYELSNRPQLQLHFFRAMESLGLRASDRIIPNSNLLEQKLCDRYSLSKTKFKVIPNNVQKIVNIDKFERKHIRSRYLLSDDDFAICTASILNETKNIGFLISAFSLLKFAEARLVIIGDSIEPNSRVRLELESLVEELGIQEKVIFTGWLDDPLNLMASLELFVLPSRQEGSPNALLEALGCGLPCFGSRIPEILEILQHDELLFSLNSENELALKLGRAIAIPNYYNKLVTLCRLRKEKFTFDWEEAVLREIGLPCLKFRIS